MWWCSVFECSGWGDEAFRTFLCSRPGRVLIAIFVMLLIYLTCLFLAANRATSIMDVNNDSLPKTGVNTTRAIEVLTELCDSFEAGLISGDSCNRLCYNRDWKINDYYEGNKVVVVMKDGGQTAVFKSIHPSMGDFPRIDKQLTSPMSTLGWPRHYKKHLMETLWPTLRRTPGESMNAADRASLWALLQQPEFILFRVLPLTRVTPKIIGTCGQFYSTEVLVAFRMKGYYMNLKGKILVHIMGTLKLFYEFLNEPLQWCDVRFDNLGLSADYPKRYLISLIFQAEFCKKWFCSLRFVLMDGDMVYTESRLRAALQGRPCATDDDCAIGDCKARCTADLTCSDRTDSNLEVFCAKLVRKLFGHTYSTHNKYLAACQETNGNITQRLNELRLTWSWNLSDV
ncbi:hypothetical protein OSTOST_19335 [Ostertagia ostertagi]